jgi:hypothetical protein|tara:strand:+ start:1359 stop:1577 length:219 start_codon:yes stop_codon:yes gene_type:complete
MTQYSLSGSILLELNMVIEADSKAEVIEEASFFLANADETLPVDAYHDGKVSITDWNFGDFELPQPEQITKT